MLDAERPDLVVYTGDNVDGLSSKDAYAVSEFGNIALGKWTEMFRIAGH